MNDPFAEECRHMATTELRPSGLVRPAEMSQLQEKEEEWVRKAIRMGMPLHKMEEYLDWLDMVRVNQEKSR
jgi:hypothetical protein